MREGIYFDASSLVITPLSYSQRLLYYTYYNLFSLKIISLANFLFLSIFEHFNLITIIIGINVYLIMTTILTIAEHYARRFAIISILLKNISPIIVIVPFILYIIFYKRQYNLSLLFDTYQIHLLLMSLIFLLCTCILAVCGKKYFFSKWHEDSYITKWNIVKVIFMDSLLDKCNSLISKPDLSK